jgi:glyoxylase-like metal-dependent hydrolase (beta-lactamase superfamily II)
MDRRDFLKLGAAAAASSAVFSFIGPVVWAKDTAQVTAAQRFKVGDVTVTALSDGYLDMQPGVFPGVNPDAFHKALEAAFLETGSYRGSVNAFIIDTGSRIYIVDAGTGANLGPTAGRLESNLTGAGYQPSSVAALIATHLHPDHIGGSFKDGKPVFDQAEFVVSEADRAYWSDAGNRSKAPEDARVFFDLATGALKAYGSRVRTISGETEVFPGVTAVPLPGHTPGHTGYRITSGGDSLLIWGDIVHAIPVQLPDPGVTTSFDVDQPLAAKTRKALLEQVAADRVLVAGAHIPFPGVGHIEKAREGYRFIPATWQYL